jgi:serine protease
MSGSAALALVVVTLALPANALDAVSPASGIRRPTASRTTTTFHAPDRLVPGKVLVKLSGIGADALLKADKGDARARAVVENAVAALPAFPGLPLHYERRLPAGYALLSVPTDDEDVTESVVDHLRGAKGVEGVAVDRWYRPLRTPNDQFFDLMWHLQPIGAPGAWDLTVGASGQTVGVVDTGTFRAHEDLVGKDAGGFDFVSTQGSNDGDGRDANYNDPGDGCGQTEDSFHGSHVAGTILANANNGIGISGLNWNARLMTARVLGCGGGDNVDIMEGLAWLTGAFDIPADPNNPNGASVPNPPAALRPRVANMSLGGQGPCDDFSRDVLQAVLDQGMMPIVAAGNDGGPVNSPANCPAAIAVGAYGPGSDNPLAGYSSFGNEVAIVAPGGDQDASGRFEDGVLSFYSNAIDPPYTFLEGTSMATPHVTGSVSLMLAMNPALSRSDVVSILSSTGDFCRGCNGKPALRVDRAVAAAGSVAPTQPGDTCSGFCSPGQACVDGTCHTTCVSDPDCSSGELCDPVDAVCIPDGGGGGGGGSGGGGGGGGGGGFTGTCDPDRGNMDCASGTGCIRQPDGTGKCLNGADDGVEIGELCEDDIDCETGLCDRGVCTVTCDFDGGNCRDGYVCDEIIIPGGLCRPEPCDEEGEDFCGAGASCQLSPQGDQVCANGAGSLCAGTSPRDVTVYALFAVAFAVRRRRR